MDELSERSISEWFDLARDTLTERGLDYGDPRSNLLRIYELSKLLGVQLRDPSELALVFIATKLSRIMESPGREDSYLDLIGYASILAQLRHTDWSDFGTF